MVLGSTSGGGGCCATVTLNTQISWSTGAADMQTVLLHELGHAFGLAHSAWLVPRVTMYPIIFGVEFLDADDMVGISTLWDTYTQVQGGATDIGVGSNGTAWIIGTTPIGLDFDIRRYNGTGWDLSDGFAVRIAVDPTGVPWVVNSGGFIYYRGSADPFSPGAWQLMPGSAVDIGVGADGSVWVVGTISKPDGFGLYKFNGTCSNGTCSCPNGVCGWNADVNNVGALRVTVSPSGKPWTVGASGAIKRRSTSDPANGTWETLTGNARDIGAGPGHQETINGFMTDGTEWHVNGSVLYVWDEQPGSGSGGSVIPQSKQWRVGGDDRGSGGGSPRSLTPIAVSAGPGVHWVVSSSGAIFKSIH
jgi:hypothetical protein